MTSPCLPSRPQLKSNDSRLCSATNKSINIVVDSKISKRYVEPMSNQSAKPLDHSYIYSIYIYIYLYLYTVHLRTHASLGSSGVLAI